MDAQGGEGPDRADVVASQTAPDHGREAWDVLWDLGMRLRDHATAVATSLDLTPMQLLTLRRIAPGAALPMNALADMLICDASNVTGIIDKLEARGLIVRRPDDKDRRVKMLVLTEEGAKMRRRCLDKMREPPPAISALPRAEQERLRDSLRGLLATWPGNTGFSASKE